MLSKKCPKEINHCLKDFKNTIENELVTPTKKVLFVNQNTIVEQCNQQFKERLFSGYSSMNATIRINKSDHEDFGHKIKK